MQKSSAHLLTLEIQLCSIVVIVLISNDVLLQMVGTSMSMAKVITTITIIITIIRSKDIIFVNVVTSGHQVRPSMIKREAAMTRAAE